MCFCSAASEALKDTSGQSTAPLQCPDAMPECERCLYPCHSGTCTNKSCQIVSLLLNCNLVTTSSSKVLNCPEFRACPKCHSLMMHTGGCKYVTCTQSQCKFTYCFICLRYKHECKKDSGYFSLECSKPRAARQRFRT